MVQYLKLLKLNSFINITTSISWNIQSNEVHIFCDSGRIIRPIFNLIKKDKNNDKYNSLINGDYSLIETWKKGIHGYLYQKYGENLNFEQNEYFRMI